MLAHTRRAASRLLAWYRATGRDLPWRRDPNPYRVWISEIMLQQTTVAVAGRYFERFISQYPTVWDLARAGDEDLLALWSGLGYYHRARNLLKAARIICERHGGEIPADAASLRALPGVGPYTTGAILSIGHNIPVAALDGNTLRVGARLGAIQGDPKTAAVSRRIEDLVQGMIPRRQASSFNQALMDLGALVCTPLKPACPACPLSADCLATRRGLTARIPKPKRTARAVPVQMAAVAVRRGERCLLVQRSGGALMQGLWEFPLVSITSGGSTEGAIELADRLGARLIGPVGRVSHSITNHRLRITVFAARPAGARRSRARVGRSLVVKDRPRLETGMEKVSRRWSSLSRVAAGNRLAVTATALKIARLLEGIA